MARPRLPEDQLSPKGLEARRYRARKKGEQVDNPQALARADRDAMRQLMIDKFHSDLGKGKAQVRAVDALQAARDLDAKESKATDREIALLLFGHLSIKPEQVLDMTPALMLEAGTDDDQGS